MDISNSNYGYHYFDLLISIFLIYDIHKWGDLMISIIGIRDIHNLN